MRNTLLCGLLCVTMTWFVGCTPKEEAPLPGGETAPAGDEAVMPGTQEPAQEPAQSPSQSPAQQAPVSKQETPVDGLPVPKDSSVSPAQNRLP